MSRLLGFDGVRAIACLLVIFHHSFQRLAIDCQPGIIAFIKPLFQITAASGVSIFFVLSGALLSIPFWKSYFDDKAMPSILNYVKKRAARIMPGFYIALTVSFLFELAVFPEAPAYHIWRYIAGLTFTAGFHYITFFPMDINGPLWSISLEVFSYCLLPIFMAVMFAFLNKRSFRIGIGYWLAVFALILAANGLVLDYFQTDNINKGWQYGTIGGAKYWMPNYNPIGFFAHYLLGILAAGCLIGLEKNNALRERLSPKKIFDYIAGFGLLTFFGILWTQRFTPDFSFSWQNQPYYYPYLAGSVAIVLVAVPYTHFVGRILDNHFFKFTAKISFGLYIWHQFIMEIYGGTLFPDYHVFMCSQFSRWLGITIFSVATAYLIATLSWYFIEKPVLDRVHGITKEQQDKKTVMPILRKVIVAMLFGAFLTNSVFQVNNAEETVSVGEGNGKIRIEIKNIRNTNGQIMVALCNSSSDFPAVKTPYKNVKLPSTGSTAEAVFDDIPYGVYAVVICHDENSNNMPDMSGGFPKEGYGATNNPQGLITFSNAKFILNSEEVTQSINMNYL